MTYRIVFSRPAEEDYRRIRDRTVLQRLSAAINALADEPHPPTAGKLSGIGEVWRIRVGNWRVCYAIEDDRLVILILTVAQRGDVYERLRRRLGR
ncbi:MAG: type II toxin-antitoxin system RelE/ParE family toxin [Spirochaetaceae bacterium]|nr:type II toxin-antitoxin system RelE/ParE family toxin [Spirochaetaceae bacterium]